MKLFDEHRDAFEKLQKMSAEDEQKGWYFTYPLGEQSKTNELRLADYKKLVSEISPCNSVASDNDGDMRFIFAGGAVFGAEWIKGIEYVPGNYERVGVIAKQGLDKARKFPPNVYLLPIEPKWYLIYQRTSE